MSAVLVASDLFPFADGNAGHVVDLGSAPSPGDVDAMCVISVTVISGVTGFGAALNTHLDNDDVQLYSRTAVGGEGSAFTVTTAGDFNTMVCWQRWRGLDNLDTHSLAFQDGVPANQTPPATTGALATDTDLVVAFALMTTTFGGVQVGTWSAGFTPDQEEHLGAAGFGVYCASAYKVPAGTAEETPVFSWDSDAISNRQMALLSYTVTAAPPSSGVNPESILRLRRRRGR